MNKIKFYMCPDCGNIITSMGDAVISCCNKPLTVLSAKTENENHVMNLKEIEGDYFVTFDHEMSKTHYIAFVAYVGYDRVLLVKLYPEQSGELRFPKMQGSKIYAYCNQHGLWENRA